MNTVAVSFSVYGRSLSSRRQSGEPDYEFLALPRAGGGYDAWIPPDGIGGARILGRMVYELDLPVGALRKTVRREICRSHPAHASDFGYAAFLIEGRSPEIRRSITEVYRLTVNGKWESVKFIRNKKIAGNWATVIELDGQQVEV